MIFGGFHLGRPGIRGKGGQPKADLLYISYIESIAKTYRFATPTLKQIKCCFFGRRLAVKILKPLDYFLFINTHAKTIGVGRIRTRDLPLKDRVEYIFAFDGPPDPPKKHLAP